MLTHLFTEVAAENRAKTDLYLSICDEGSSVVMSA